MIRICMDCCRQIYDDAERSTVCPHEEIYSKEIREQKDLAFLLLGKKVRFRHLPPGNPTAVQSINWCGMVTIQGLPGEFAPHLFVVEE